MSSTASLSSTRRRVAPTNPLVRLGSMALLVLLALASTACRQDMHDQPKYEVFESSTFFDDGKSARLPPENTVARTAVLENDAYHTGYGPGDVLVEEIPMAITSQVLKRGQQRYDGFCSPCHGRTGDGRGMVVQRGYKQPPSFHTERLVDSPAGHYFDAITIGFGQMPAYASQIKVEDRWAIIAYVRALQLSQKASLADLSDEDRRRATTIEIPGADDAHGEAGHGAADADH